jgi:hypothetical protein
MKYLFKPSFISTGNLLNKDRSINRIDQMSIKDAGIMNSKILTILNPFFIIGLHFGRLNNSEAALIEPETILTGKIVINITR